MVEFFWGRISANEGDLFAVVGAANNHVFQVFVSALTIVDNHAFRGRDHE